MTQPGGAGFLLYIAVTLALAGYFAFAAIQGDLGILTRLALTAEADAVSAQRNALAAEVDELRNLSRRLSDGFLDLDLLDERARLVLGLLRPDEVVLR